MERVCVLIGIKYSLNIARKVQDDIIKRNKMKKLRITQEQANAIYEEAGLFLLENYKGSKYKHLCQDNEGYRYSLSLDCVKDKRTKHFNQYSKRNSQTIYNLKLFIQENGLRCELLEEDGKIVTEKDKLHFRCGLCGESYALCFNHLLINQKDTCNKCSYGLAGENNKLPIEYYEKVLSEKGYSFIEGLQQGYRKIYIQDAKGYKYITSLPNLQANTTPIKFHKLNPYTIENMKLYLKENGIPVILLEDDSKQGFSTRDEYLSFSCMECGREYKATWGQVISTQRYRCEYCSKVQSKYECFVEQYLIECEVYYIKQKRYDDCRNIRALPFDFYLPDYNYIIEVHGQQHYYENDMFPESLEHRQYIDKIKEDYCHNNNIGFVAIPFWLIINANKTERYKEIINNIIN